MVYAEGTIPRHHTESFFSSLGLALPAHALQTLDVALARALVACSDAVWITPLGAAQDELRAGRLVRLAIDTPGTEEPVGLLLRSEAEASAPRSALAGLLREAARRQAEAPNRALRRAARRLATAPAEPQRRAGLPDQFGRSALLQAQEAINSIANRSGRAVQSAVARRCTQAT